MEFDKPQENNMGADPSSNIQWFIMNCIMKMRDAKMANKEHEYWVNFDWAFRILANFMTLDERKAIEEEYQKVVQTEIKIRTDKSAHNKTKEDELNHLHAGFADAHLGMLFKSLPRTSIIRLSDEGAIDFTKLDYENLKGIIRNSTGSGSVKEEEVAPNDGSTISEDAG